MIYKYYVVYWNHFALIMWKFQRRQTSVKSNSLVEEILITDVTKQRDYIQGVTDNYCIFTSISWYG